jgi:hypothetical protein
MQATTPIGSRRTVECPTLLSAKSVGSRSAKTSNCCIGKPTWIRRVSFTGIPTSATMIAVNSSLFATNASWQRFSSRIRSSTGVADQDGKARRAALTATSTSTSSASGTSPMTCSVNGLVTSIRLPDTGFTQPPSIYN